MDKPQLADVPGLAWRPRKNGWAAVWLARQDIVAEKGFKPSTRQILVLAAAPTGSQEHAIRTACVKFQEEMYAFVEGKPKTFGGRLRDLINAYQTDADSPYHGARVKVRRNIDNILKKLDHAHGPTNLADLGLRDFKRWYEKARWPDGMDGCEKAPTAHALMTVVRMIFSFGYSFEIEKVPAGTVSQCARLKLILHEMKFQKGRPRTESMTLRQCEGIIAAATFPSIALAQAIQFDLRVRQKDVIGEWVPTKEPGVSDITRGGRKWLRGLRWEEISSTMVVEHRMSKSRTGKVIRVDLNEHPMVMAELAKIPPEKRMGPVVICEITGRPWTPNNFRIYWRKTADAAGVPKTVWNMDSRAGGITETIEATGGNLEAARKQAGHSDIKTTQIYSRRELESNKDTAAKVVDFRSKNRA